MCPKNPDKTNIQIREASYRRGYQQCAQDFAHNVMSQLNIDQQILVHSWLEEVKEWRANGPTFIAPRPPKLDSQ